MMTIDEKTADKEEILDDNILDITRKTNTMELRKKDVS